MSEIRLIAAQTENRVIGRAGGMPWHLPADLQHFKARTSGCPIVMGRRTFESLGRALPARDNRVISSRPNFQAPDVQVHDSLAGALQALADAPVVYVIGGGELYRAAMPLADVLEITWIHTVLEGDTLFPEIAPDMWLEAERVFRPRDEKNSFDLSFVRYLRRV